MAGDGYIIEITRLGNGVRVTAIDPVTGIEVSMVGDPSVGQAELSRLAARKLEFVLAKRRGTEAAPKAADTKTAAGKPRGGTDFKI